MAWTAPKTWAVNETLTAANLNTYNRDNHNWLANDHPRCSAIRTAAQSISDSTGTEINLTGTDEFDVGAMHDPGSNPNRITVPSGAGGLYFVQGGVEFAANGTGRRLASVFKNGAVLSPSLNQSVAAASAGNSTSVQVSGLVALAAGDYVSLNVFQNSGGALNVNAARLQALWVAF